MFQKRLKKKWDLHNLHVVIFGKVNCINSGVTLNKKDYTNPAMEAEFGIILNRDIKAELSSFDYILESIEGIYPLIEIHNLSFYGNEPYGAELLANNAIHAGVVLGPETKLPIDKIETRS